MELEKYSGVGIGKLVNSKEVSPVEVIDYFARRIEERNPALNAFVYTKVDEAMNVAKAQEASILRGHKLGPLAGVPVGLKDFLPSKFGWTNSHGGVECLIMDDPYDSEFTKAAERLGAIPIGKTNAPAFGFSGCCTNEMYGPTHNPYDLDRNSGGSSGGSAAAVADKLVPISEAGDAGGSIRIPAAWCNCFGFKAGLGMIPSVCRPDGWAATHPYCFPGAITNTVEDSLVIYNAMNGYDPLDPYSLPFNKDAIELNSSSRYKIALTCDFDMFDVDDEITAVIKEFASKLRSHRFHVDEVKFNFKHKLEEFIDMWCTAISVDTALDIAMWKENGLDLFKDYTNQVPEKFIEYNKKAANMNIFDFRKFNELRTEILDEFERVFKKYDMILSPVSTCLPVKNSELTEVDTIGFAMTFLVNFTGHPAASIPAGFTESMLPVGAHFIASKYHEQDIFNIARAIEIAHPWNISTDYIEGE